MLICAMLERMSNRLNNRLPAYVKTWPEWARPSTKEEAETTIRSRKKYENHAIKITKPPQYAPDKAKELWVGALLALDNDKQVLH